MPDPAHPRLVIVGDTVCVTFPATGLMIPCGYFKSWLWDMAARHPENKENCVVLAAWYDKEVADE